MNTFTVGTAILGALLAVKLFRQFISAPILYLYRYLSSVRNFVSVSSKNSSAPFSECNTDPSSSNLSRKSSSVNVSSKEGAKQLALLIVYSGDQFAGFHRNSQKEDTISYIVLDAMHSCGFLVDAPHAQYKNVGCIVNSSAGVHSSRQLMTCSISSTCALASDAVDTSELSEQLNNHLPKAIRVLCTKKTDVDLLSMQEHATIEYKYLFPYTPFESFISKHSTLDGGDEPTHTPGTQCASEKFTHWHRSGPAIDLVCLQEALELFAGQKNCGPNLSTNLMIQSAKFEVVDMDGFQFLSLTLVAPPTTVDRDILSIIGMCLTVGTHMLSLSSVRILFENMESECHDQLFGSLPVAPPSGLMLSNILMTETQKRRKKSKFVFGSDVLAHLLDVSANSHCLFEKRVCEWIRDGEMQHKTMETWLRALYYVSAQCPAPKRPPDLPKSPTELIPNGTPTQMSFDLQAVPETDVPCEAPQISPPSTPDGGKNEYRSAVVYRLDQDDNMRFNKLVNDNEMYSFMASSRTSSESTLGPPSPQIFKIGTPRSRAHLKTIGSQDGRATTMSPPMSMEGTPSLVSPSESSISDDLLDASSYVSGKHNRLPRLCRTCITNIAKKGWHPLLYYSDAALQHMRLQANSKAREV